MTARLTTLMYHYVRPADELQTAGYGGLDVDVFDAQLDEICRHATPVGWPAVAAALEGRQDLPNDAVLLTFDDGFVDHVRHVLPRLTARGLSGTFFVLARKRRDGLTLAHRLHVLIATLGSNQARTAIVDRMSEGDRLTHATLEARALAERPGDPEDAWKRPLQRELRRAVEPTLADLVAQRLGREDEIARQVYMDARDLGELVSEGMTLGGHGREHLWLDFEDASTVRSELRASTQLLADLGTPPWAFAYPFGGVSGSAVNEVERAGFVAAFTTVRRDHGPFRLGRIDGEAVRPSDIALAVSR